MKTYITPLTKVAEDRSRTKTFVLFDENGKQILDFAETLGYEVSIVYEATYSDDANKFYIARYGFDWRAIFRQDGSLIKKGLVKITPVDEVKQYIIENESPHEWSVVDHNFKEIIAPIPHEINYSATHSHYYTSNGIL